MTAPRAEHDHAPSVSRPRHPLVYDSVLDLIGDTPLVKIDDFVTKPRPRPRSRGVSTAPRQGAQLWGKLENANPAGSVKDRISQAMIESAERDGLLQPGGTVIEP